MDDRFERDSNPRPRSPPVALEPELFGNFTFDESEALRPRPRAPPDDGTSAKFGLLPPVPLSELKLNVDRISSQIQQLKSDLEKLPYPLHHFYPTRESHITFPPKMSYSNHKSSNTIINKKSQKSSKNGQNTDDLVISDNDTEKLTAAKKTHLQKPPRSSSKTKSSKTPSKNIYDERPAFNLDTKIDGYDDVDDNGRYKKKASESVWNSERKKQKQVQEELNQQWAESLRDRFHVQ